MVKSMWKCANGPRKAWHMYRGSIAFKVCRLGPVAIKGVPALKSVHKGPGASQTFHILISDFLGLLLPILFTENI